MTLINKSLELLKTDIAGRVRTSPERREALLDEFERDGLSGMRFAARYGLKYPTFASWVARRRREQMEAAREPERRPQSDSARDVHGRASAPVPAKPLRWLEAIADTTSAEAAPARSVMLHLPCGVRMEVEHADQAALAAALVRAFSSTGIPPAGGGGGHGGAPSLRVPTSSLPPSC